MLLLAVTACDNADYSKSAPFDNGVYLSVAESKTSETMTFNKTIIQREKSFTARLANPAGTDVTVNVTVDPSQVEAYNSRNNTSYDILPTKHYRLESNEMTIRAGKINSAPLHIYFENLTELEIDKAYLCPVSLNSAQGVGLLDGSTTYWYIVKRSSAITTAVDLRYCYVEVPGFYVPKWGTEPAGNAAHLNNLKAVTFEIIIRISNFDEANTDISSLMGIEQYFCFRAGDAGFPRQQLQIQTPAGKFPEANKAKLLKENEWYHLALTYDIEDPENEAHLAAYWKFNEGSSNDIKDYSKYHNDAHIVRYWKDFNSKEEYDVKNEELWPSGIEVPQVNRED